MASQSLRPRGPDLVGLAVLEASGELLGELLQIARAHGAIKHGHQTDMVTRWPGRRQLPAEWRQRRAAAVHGGWHKSCAGKREKTGSMASAVRDPQPQAPKHKALDANNVGLRSRRTHEAVRGWEVWRLPHLPDELTLLDDGAFLMR